MVMVHGLMVAGLGMKPDLARWCGPETDKARVVALQGDIALLAGRAVSALVSLDFGRVDSTRAFGKPWAGRRSSSRGRTSG